MNLFLELMKSGTLANKLENTLLLKLCQLSDHRRYLHWLRGFASPMHQYLTRLMKSVPISSKIILE